MPNRDLILLETVRTHRARLTSAFVHGELDERRVTNDGTRRLLAGLVLAAVVCAGCVGFSFVAALLGRQAAAAREQAAAGPATGPVFVSDAFDRSSTDGWGAAVRGGRWQTAAPASSYRVDGGAASIQLAAGQSRSAYLPGVVQDRADLQLTLGRATGTGADTVAVAVLARRVSADRDYRSLVSLDPDGSVAVTLARVSSGTIDGPRQDLSDTVVLFRGQPPTTGEPPPAVTVRMQAIGTNPTTLRVKAWPAGTSEPAGWTLEAGDSTSDLQRPGTVGLAATVVGAPTGQLSVRDVVGRVAP